jgi:hypothetical protein
VAERRLAELPPLFFGRLSRVLAGAATLYWAAEVWSADWGDLVLAAVLVWLGLSFLAGGLMGNPGCEITALPNLLLPAKKRVHCA